MTNEVPAPAGWYDDGTGRQRWFDGTSWGDYAEEQAAPATSAELAVDDSPVVIRRTRRAPFVPPSEEREAQAAGLTVSRNWGLGLRSANAKRESGMTRNRKIAGDLPAWCPLPPGELAVDRTRGQRG